MVDTVQVPQAPQEQVVEQTSEEKALEILGKAEVEAALEPEQEPKAPQTEEPEESRTASWAKLAERDKEIRQLKTKLKETEKEGTLRDLVKTDPARALQEMGIGIDQVLDILANQVSTPRVEEPRTDNEVAKLKQELEQFKQEQQHRYQKEAMRVEMDKVSTLVSSDKERWELIDALRDEGTHALVLDTAAEFYKATGDLPSYAEVMDTVEKHLEEQMSSKYERLGALRKIQSRYNAVKIGDKAKEVEKMAPKGASQTLSTAHSAAGPQPMGSTEAERFARALTLLEKSGD